VRASAILKRFADDFAGVGGVPAFLRANAPPTVPRTALEPRAITYLDYDWSLNDRARSPAGSR